MPTLGEVFKTDIAVRLPKRKRRRCPDVFFVAKDRLDILREKHIEGPPDFILEIVSRDSVERDWRDKYLDYEAERVPEYWIVDSLSKRVEAYRLGKRGKYRPIALADGKLESTAIPGFWSRPEWLLGPERPTVREMLRLLGV